MNNAAIKENKAFALVEVVIVIVIVAILSAVSVPVYKSHIKKATEVEAKVLADSIFNAEDIYYSEYGEFYANKKTTSYDKVLKVDTRENKYFTSFYIDTNTDGWYAKIYGKDSTTQTVSTKDLS